MEQKQQAMEKIFSFFKQKGRAKNLTHDADLFRGGYVDSLFAFEIVRFLEESFGVRIPNREITEKNFKTIESIAALALRLSGKES